MIKKKLFILLAAAGTMTVSCVDNNYKLSDLDTTVGVSVNNLTIPLNVDSLLLDQVLDLDEDGKVKKQVLPDGTELTTRGVIEGRIGYEFRIFETAVKSGDAVAMENQAQELLVLIDNRNNKCKALK